MADDMPKISFKWEFGPGAILTALGILIQAGVVVWVVSSYYTGTNNTIAAQGAKIDRIEEGSKKRFEAVQTAIDNSHTAEIKTETRLTTLETTIGFIKDSVTRLEARVQK